jgi:hypothetical protein
MAYNNIFSLLSFGLVFLGIAVIVGALLLTVLKGVMAYFWMGFGKVGGGRPERLNVVVRAPFVDALLLWMHLMLQFVAKIAVCCSVLLGRVEFDWKLMFSVTLSPPSVTKSMWSFFSLKHCHESSYESGRRSTYL